jgi:replication factor C small subunit
MLWTEKYRPSKLSDVLGQEHFVMDAEHWVLNKECPNLLLYGNSGTGKTGAAVALANAILGKDALSNFFEINASDDRRLETVRTKIKNIAQESSIGDVPFRIVLLDEMDGMTNDAQNALKRLMERYESNIRFIITCNNRNKIIYALQSRCANYFFKNLTFEVIEEAIVKILEAENYPVPEEIRSFIYAFNGDMRRTLTELQASVASGIRLTTQIEKGLKKYEQITMNILNNNPNEALKNLHNLIYEGISTKEICIGLHDYIVSSEMDSNKKLKFLRVIGEGEWRSHNMTPKLLVSWMVGNLQ